jgi:tetracycline repressor-like protein
VANLRAFAREPASLDRRWRTLIGDAVAAGAIDDQIDAGVLRHVLRCTMLQVGIMVWERGAPAGDPGPSRTATSIIFDGLAEARLQERRGMILDVARSQFAQRGPEATTMRDIADVAGIPAGNLYRYFASKDAMVTEVLSEFSDRLLEAYRDVLRAASSVAETLEAICWLLD